MEQEKYMQEMLAAYKAMDDRAREKQLRLAKRAALDWPRKANDSPATELHGKIATGREVPSESGGAASSDAR
jgi:hypothetical protein